MCLEHQCVMNLALLHSPNENYSKYAYNSSLKVKANRIISGPNLVCFFLGKKKKKEEEEQIIESLLT